MRLTIITAVKNNLAGLQRTYESLRSQVNQELAWLVIDGQSTDGTLEWLATLDTPRPQIVSEPDRSLFEAMNKAVARLQTEYCLFLNGGDFLWDPRVTERILAAISAQPFVLGYGNFVIGAVPGFPQRERGRPITTTLQMFRGPIPCHQSMVISKQAFRENGLYREDLGIYGDHEWILRYAKKRSPSEFTYLPFVVCFYEPNGLSYRRFFDYGPTYLRMLRETGDPLEILAGVAGWLKTATYVALSSAKRRAAPLRQR